MVELTEQIIEMVNKPGRIGVLCTVDADGKPNAAYFGSPRIRKNNQLSLGLMGGQTLANLKVNKHAVFMCLEDSPVTFKTPGCRIYLEVAEIATEGPFLEQIQEELTPHIGKDAAAMIANAVSFNITQVRNIVDMV